MTIESQLDKLWENLRDIYGTFLFCKNNSLMGPYADSGSTLCSTQRRHMQNEVTRLLQEYRKVGRRPNHIKYFRLWEWD